MDDLLVMDLLTPPIIGDAADEDYLLARLRETSILKSIMLFLAYLHVQPSIVWFKGNTNISIRVLPLTLTSRARYIIASTTSTKRFKE